MTHEARIFMRIIFNIIHNKCILVWIFQPLIARFSIAIRKTTGEMNTLSEESNTMIYKYKNITLLPKIRHSNRAKNTEMLYCYPCLYGWEKRAVKLDVDNLKAFQMCLYSRMLPIRYTGTRTNVDVLSKVKTQLHQLRTIKTRKTTYFGQIMRV